MDILYDLVAGEGGKLPVHSLLDYLGQWTGNVILQAIELFEAKGIMILEGMLAFESDDFISNANDTSDSKANVDNKTS